MESATKETIIEAAEQLFAAYGFAATSLRQITATADVNLAAVNYHFRSKAALIDIVLQRMLAPLAEARLHNFERITAGANTPSLEEVLHAYYQPFFELLNSHSEISHQRKQIFGRLTNEPNEEIRRSVSNYLTPVIEQYFALFKRTVPHLSSAEFTWRFRAMHGIVATHFAETLIPAPLPKKPNHTLFAEEDSFSWAMTYLATAWRAPATNDRQST